MERDRPGRVIGRRLSQAAAAFEQTGRSPNLRRAQLSFGASWTSYWMITVALGILAFRHGGAAAVGVAGLVRTLPAALVAPLAAVVTDRYRRDRVLVGVSLGRAVAIGGAALVVGTTSSPWPAYVLVAVTLIGTTLYRPAHSALLPSLCTTADELTSANVVRGLLDSVSALAGPAIAGVLVGPIGVGGVFAVCAALALWSAWLIWRVDYEPPPRVVETSTAHPLREVLEGLAIIGRKPDIRALSALGTVQTFTRGCFSVFAVVVALQLLGLPSSGVGVLTAGFGAGAVLGSFGASMMVGSPGLAKWFGVGIAGWGVPFIALAAVSNEPAALVLLGVVGVANAIVDVSAFTLLQWLVPDEVMGRVFTTLESIWTLGAAVGSIACSGLIAVFGVRGALIAAGLVAPVSVVLALPRLRRIDSEHRVAAELVALLQRVAMLRPLPLATICGLAGEATKELAPPGQIVVREGTAGDDFYVIVDGRAEVSADGRSLGHLAAADCFGEIAGLTGSARTATVRADTRLDLLRLTGRQFVRAVSGYSPSAAVASALVEERLARTVSDAAGADVARRRSTAP